MEGLSMEIVSNDGNCQIFRSHFQEGFIVVL
jgi:hypothetical protein